MLGQQDLSYLHSKSLTLIIHKLTTLLRIYIHSLSESPRGEGGTWCGPHFIGKTAGAQRHLSTLTAITEFVGGGGRL